MTAVFEKWCFSGCFSCCFLLVFDSIFQKNEMRNEMKKESKTVTVNDTNVVESSFLTRGNRTKNLTNCQGIRQPYAGQLT